MKQKLAVPAAYVALSVAFCWPLFAQPLSGGNGDWDQHTFYAASVLRSLADGQLPFWNPWYCGGNVLWQNPQVSLVSPVYPLSLVMPLALAMKVNVVLHYLAGFVGMHLLLRRIVGLTSPAVVMYCATLFVFSGGLALHTRTGHVNFLPVFLMPALLYCFFRAAGGQIRGVLVGGAVIAFAVFNGGSHVLPLAAVLLGAIGLGALLFARTLKPLLIAAAIVVFGCLLAAPKLVPIAHFIRSAEFQDRRPVKKPDFMTADMLRRSLADGSAGTDLKVPGGVQKYGWHEYGNYMGWFGAALGVLSAIWILMFRWRRLQWRESSMAIGLIVVVFIAAGEFSPLAPANWLRTLPGFSNFRIPSRFILLVPLAASLCVAFAARAWQDRPWKPRARLSAEILCIAGVCQLLIVNREAYRDVFIIAPTEVEARVLNVGMPTIAEREPPSAALSRLGENSNLIRSMAEGVSPLNCYEQLMVRRAARPGPAGLNGGADVTISDQMFSPGEVEASVQVTRGGRGYVSLNQNFVAGWSTTFGAAERDPDSGLPYVVAPTGYSGPVWFSFTPPGLPLGFLLLVVGLLVWRFVWKHSTPAVADGRMHADVPQTDGGRTRHTHVNPIGS